MKRLLQRKWLIAGSALVLLAALLPPACRRAPRTAARQGDVAEAAVTTYVAPGDTDPYYLFYSGGHSGNIYVAGVPSMRHIITIPVFTPPWNRLRFRQRNQGNAWRIHLGGRASHRT
ncbi:MAG: hypothetical protein LC114_17110 [Bryobacterales bacterium]|nr:hypothetical protein [Bryobacterales bacterium]